MGIYNWRGVNALQNQAVQAVCWLSNDIPYFRFWASSDDADLMGEECNDIIDLEYNNTE